MSEEERLNMREKIRNMIFKYVTKEEADKIKKDSRFCPSFGLTYLHNEDLLVEGEIGIFNDERIIEIADEKSERENNIDHSIVLISEATIDVWEKYKRLEGYLAERLNKKGFSKNSYEDAKSFISNKIIDDEIRNGYDFEREVNKILERK